MAMNAHAIVNLLLEADQPNAEPSAGERSGVYVFGPSLPPDGYASHDVESALAELRRFKVIAPQVKDSATMLDALAQAGYTFFIKKNPGDVEVIGRVPAKTTPEGADEASMFLGLEKHKKVQYRQTPRSTPQAMSAEYVLYGSRELEKEQQTKAEQAKENRSVPTQQLGKIDPEEEGFKDPPTGVGYSSEMVPLNAPLQIGVTFDADSKEGVLVREVHPKSPAAQAGLQAGDTIIETGKFARNDNKEPRKYGIKTPQHLEFVLKIADPQYPIPFRVLRGDREHWLPIVGVKKQEKQQPSATIPAAEVQQHAGSKAPAQPAQAAPPAGGAPKPKQMSMAKSLFAGQQKPRQRRLNLKPNEPSPARETGNPPANVSSLT